MYTTVLVIHSWIRWAALALGIVATVSAVTRRPTERVGLFFMVVLDLQLLLGLALYFLLSPFTAQAMKDMAAAMRDASLRFWAVEHITTMIVAVALAHVGRVLARKARTPESRRTREIVCFGLATVLMIVGIPWPGMANGRPLFRV
jgi:heme A synthase